MILLTPTLIPLVRIHISVVLVAWKLKKCIRVGKMYLQNTSHNFKIYLNQTFLKVLNLPGVGPLGEGSRIGHHYKHYPRCSQLPIRSQNLTCVLHDRVVAHFQKRTTLEEELIFFFYKNEIRI